MTRDESKWADVVRGFSAVVAVGVLVVGVPVALLSLVGWPLPRGIPTWSEFTTALSDTYIPDSFLVKALALGCWVVWFELTAALIVETVGTVRGRAAAHVPLAGPLQRMAGRLVASVALLLVLISSRPDATPLRPLTPAALTSPVLTQDLAEDVELVTATAPAEQPVELSYTVKRRDTLWGISEAHLQDPYRWSEIWELNKGRPQVGGSVFRDPGHIHPGWVLRMPPDAVGLTPPSPPPPPPPAEPAPVSSTETNGAPPAEAPAVEVMVPLESDTAPPGAHRGGAETSAPEVMIPVPEDQGHGANHRVVASRDSDDVLQPEATAGIRTAARAQRLAWADALRRLRR